MTPAYLAPFAFNATLTRVVDADTILADVDFGFRRHEVDTPIRINGIAARERRDPGGPEAKANLEALLPPGTPLRLLTAKDDKFAPRWLATVEYRGPDGYVRDLATVLITDGWAAPWNGTGPQPKPPWPRRAAA